MERLKTTERAGPSRHTHDAETELPPDEVMHGGTRMPPPELRGVAPSDTLQQHGGNAHGARWRRCPVPEIGSAASL